MRLKDSALELFGEWQTTEYEPPEAKDGIVPRNEYGNVDLFKMCMLPKGTVHINRKCHIRTMAFRKIEKRPPPPRYGERSIVIYLIERILTVPGLNRIARKLNIDCATAVVGFNFGSMGAVPATEGYVVCTEYEDTLRDAWEAEQVEAAKRATEKREKRIYGNWRRLIKGLLIREKLAARYEFGKESDQTSQKETSNKRLKQGKATAKKPRT